MEIWGLGCKVRLGREQVFIGNKCKHPNLPLLGAEPAEHDRVPEMVFYHCWIVVVSLKVISAQGP